MTRFCVFLTVIFTFTALAANVPDWREIWEYDSYKRWQATDIATLRRKAISGDAVAMMFLSMKLHEQRQFDESASWRKRAADAGLPQAITEEVWGLQQSDLKTYVEAVEKAAATGFPVAKVYLAQILIADKIDSKGFIVKSDPIRAIDLLQQAADEHSNDAWGELAVLYSAGVGEPRNDGERPIILFARAANSGSTGAMLELARRRRLGFGVEKDLISAAGWAMRAYVAEGKKVVAYAGEPPKADGWLQFVSGGDVEILRRLANLYSRALLERSSSALVDLAALHVKSDWGKPNLARAAALYALAAKAGDLSADAKRAQIESKLDDTGRSDLKTNIE